MDIAKSNTKGGQKLDRLGIGKKLRELRGTRTIQEVSDATGIPWSTICMYELGQRLPGDDNKIILANYYNVTVGELFFEMDIAKSNIP